MKLGLALAAVGLVVLVAGTVLVEPWMQVVGFVVYTIGALSMFVASLEHLGR